MLCAPLTGRTRLRLIDHQDAANLFTVIDSNREHLRHWHPWVDAVDGQDDTTWMIAGWEKQNADGRGFCAAIIFDGRLCGVVHHLNIDRQNAWTALGYWLDKAHQGKGIMTLCCRAVIVHAFTALNLNRVTIECAVDNARSRALPERLGFTLEGIVRSIERLHDHYADHAVYGLLKSECKFLPAQPVYAGHNNDLSVPASDATSQMEQPPFRAGPDVALRPADSFDHSLKLAFELHNAGRSDDAEALCRLLAQLRPRDSQLLFLLGMVLHRKNQDAEAVRNLSKAAEYLPNSARIFKGLGCAFEGLKDYRGAAHAFERALELQPAAPDNYYNLGKACYRLEQIERATTLFERAVEMNPRDYNSWNNLGKCFKELNRLDESIGAYNRALEIMPDYALARYGRAISLLAAGRFTEGFQEYEWRWSSITPRNFSQPAWQGQAAQEATLFIHAEQGFGDAIQMARFIPLARERVGRVILECRPELTRLFEYSRCADLVIPHGSTVPAFDYFIPLLSLPRVLGIMSDTIPLARPYLQAPPHETLESARAGSLKVGIAWAGNPRHPHDGARSVPLDVLAPVLQLPNCAFYSLQHRFPDRDRAILDTMRGIVSSPFQDFLDTASAVAGLDLVIAVDTAVAHLAGALGKPVWLLLQYSPDWRWFPGNAETPWYPKMRLFRQERRNDWTNVITRVVAELRRTGTAPPGRETS